MDKIRVLGIAPYHSLAVLLQQAGNNRPDIDLTVYTGDLEDGAAIASRYTTADYDFILSRGGTAELIRQVSSIPTLEIEVSAFDLLRCIQIAQNASERYALIGFPNITKNADFLKTLLKSSMDIYTIHSQEEADTLLKSFSQNRYDVVLSDSVSDSLAKSFSFHTVLITSGMESVESALNQIAFFWSVSRKLYWDSRLFRSLLGTHPFDIYVFSPDQKLLFHSREDLYSRELLCIMQELVPAVLADGKKKVYRKHSGLLASISGSKKTIGQQEIVQFYVNLRKMPLSLFKNGLHYKNREEILNNHGNVYLDIVPQHFTEELMERLVATRSPILLLSEYGMARDDFAEAFYLQSRDHVNPLTQIDCARLASSKNWDYLMQDMDSPLSDTETTIYIKNIDILPEQKFREFLASINDTKLHFRNRILFEMRHQANTPYPERCIIIQNRFNCVTLELPPLRYTPEHIPQMASLLVNAYNGEYGKEIVSLDPAALSLLQEFDWPYNYTQFRRVITRLGHLADTPFIHADSVRSVLHSEALICSDVFTHPETPALRTVCLSLDKDLDHLTKDIIEAVLHEENNNQSAAAKRLGISRTTLWRMLKA